MIDARKNNQVVRENKKIAAGDMQTDVSDRVAQYKSISFFLERTSESIKRTTSMIQELESEVGRLRYELMATENEYKNLQHMCQDLELNLIKRSSEKDIKD